MSYLHLVSMEYLCQLQQLNTCKKRFMMNPNVGTDVLLPHSCFVGMSQSVLNSILPMKVKDLKEELKKQRLAINENKAAMSSDE